MEEIELGRRARMLNDWRVCLLPRETWGCQMRRGNRIPARYLFRGARSTLDSLLR